ncbi:hypothetical protein [uncultured Tenacibaculum sp.]|uniref:hypothetical protein n=1 Tax=uncultured Tenacibaculum sp. TaxID=174713 RepID=UPI002611BCA5|nr:hypothetical protein [uncultured Tenacibaculum sp.]
MKFILEIGKGVYGKGNTQITGKDLYPLDFDLHQEIAQLKSSIAAIPKITNAALLNSITAEQVTNWNEGDLTSSEEKQIKTLLKWRNESFNVNNFYQPLSIPAFPWTDGSSIVTFNNYNLTECYLLINTTTSTRSVNWDNLKNETKIGVSFYVDALKAPLSIYLERTTEIAVPDFVVFKPSDINSRNFFKTHFAPNTNGAFSKDLQVYPLK